MDNYFAINPELTKPFFYISLVTNLLLIAALFTKRANRLANSILAALLTVALLAQGIGSAESLSSIESYPYLLRAAFPLSLLGAALTYLYVLALTDPQFRLQKKYFLYLAPCFGALVWYLGFLGFVQDPLYWTQSQPLLWERYARTVAIVATFGTFLFLSYKRLEEFQKSAGDYFSNLRAIQFRWLRFLLGVISCLWAFSVIDLVTGPLFPLWQFQPAAVSVATFALALYALRLAPVFAFEEPAAEANVPEPVAGQKYSDEELARWGARLLEYMGQQTPYLNPDLRLPELARAIGIKPYMLTETLNRHLGVSFFQFINRYRVDEAKRRLADPKCDHLSVLGVAMESGFNSKSAFNETFRTLTGSTPSVFRVQAKK